MIKECQILIFKTFLINLGVAFTALFGKVPVKRNSRVSQLTQLFVLDRIKPLVCASLGPYGAFLSDASEYTGEYVEKISSQVCFNHFFTHTT